MPVPELMSIWMAPEIYPTATSLARSICPILGVGTYRRDTSEREVLYVLVPSTSAQRAAHALAEYGFKVLAVHF